jgi:hypothetical protein
MAVKPSFKECSGCGKVWRTANNFLKDKSLRLNGYQWNLLQEKSGLLVYTHERDHCGSTISVRAQSFSHHPENIITDERKN